MHCRKQTKLVSTAPSLNPPRHLDHTGTGTFTITAGYYNFPLKQYGPTAYIHLRRPSEDKLEHYPIIAITDEDEWEPYKASHNIYDVNSTPILNSEETIPDDEYIDDWLLFYPDQRISERYI